MIDPLERDGLARITRWQKTKDGPLSATTPDLIFIRTERIPVPPEAGIILTANPSVTGAPVLYHRGTAFASRPALSEVKTSSLNPEGSVLAELGPYLWQPSGSEQYLRSIEGNLDSKVVFESSTDEELDRIRKDPAVELVVLGNSMELFQRPRNFVGHLMRLEKILGRAKLIYAPGLGEPRHLALLAYMGVDLFDTLPLISHARDGELVLDSGILDFQDIKNDWSCSCLFCREWRAREMHEPEFQVLLGHNYALAQAELGIVRSAIRTGKLRELVESRLASDIRSVNMLRFLDRLHYDFVERYIPVARKTTLYAPTTESLKRPEIVRFRNRIRERYVRPDPGRVLLLLPCSAKKPYSFSKSHRIYSSAINACANPGAVHEVILTSPLGIVPRELELAYPAGHYDIPVTGVWFHEEAEFVRKQLKWLLDNFEYDHVIAHLDEDEMFLIEGIKNIESTGGKNATSDASLKRLTEILNDAAANMPKVSWNEQRVQSVKTLACFHFGSDGGRALTENIEIKGKYPYLKILHEGKQLGMIEPETGLISLTLAGGERILSTGAYTVEIEDFEMKGDVFAPAVIDASDEIRPGDEVVVFTKTDPGKKIKAVGRAVMNGAEMVEANRGRAVKIRHYNKQR